MISTGVADYEVYARGPAEGNIHKCMHKLYSISNSRIVQELTSSRHYITAKIHSIYRDMTKYVIFRDMLIKNKSRCTKCGPGFSFKTSKLSGTDKIRYWRIPQLS